MKKSKKDEIITNIDKILHRYSSGNRKDNGKKIVAELSCQKKKIYPDNTIKPYWLVILYWVVGYIQKDKSYLCTKVKQVPFYCKTKRDTNELFDFLVNYIKTTSYPTTKIGDKIIKLCSVINKKYNKE